MSESCKILVYDSDDPVKVLAQLRKVKIYDFDARNY